MILKNLYYLYDWHLFIRSADVYNALVDFYCCFKTVQQIRKLYCQLLERDYLEVKYLEDYHFFNLEIYYFSVVEYGLDLRFCLTADDVRKYIQNPNYILKLQDLYQIELD